MHRRDWLKWAASTPVLMGSGRLFAAPQAGSRLLVVFMRGGYDAASLLVPIDSEDYYAARPNIAIARDATVHLSDGWGLHPAMEDALLPLYRRKQLAFIPFAGTEDLSRSHFDTQNSIELGQPMQGSRDFGSGFLNRLVAQISGDTTQAVAFTPQLPLILRGELDLPNLALPARAPDTTDARHRKLIETMYAETVLAETVREGFALRAEANDAFEQKMMEADGGAPSPAGFEGQIRRIATLMRDRFHVGFVDVGGWDTHVNQGAATGALATRLGTLGNALAGFADAMGPVWDDTVVVVISEFGRTFRENGNKGTDHGHGTVYWVLGGKVDGGRLAGEQVKVSTATLHQDRDYPLLNEYRSVLGGLFRRMYGLNQTRLQAIFGGVEAKDLRLV